MSRNDVWKNDTLSSGGVIQDYDQTAHVLGVDKRKD